LPRLFDSLPPGMPVLVLDHESTDGTAMHAVARGAQVITRPFAGFVDARRFALSQVKTPWTLMIDADERLDDVLRAALLEAPGDADGYIVRRTTSYCGKPLRMWSNEPLLRLFRTDRARLVAAPAAGGQAQLHEHWVCDGKVHTLPGTLLHDSYPDAGSYRRKYEEYTAIEARGVARSLPAALVQTLLVPLRLANLLVRRGALLDGPGGWIVAWHSALYPAVVRWKSIASD
jgi:glycosyltransferase involved in cell wall biosynthesis